MGGGGRGGKILLSTLLGSDIGVGIICEFKHRLPKKALPEKQGNSWL